MLRPVTSSGTLCYCSTRAGAYPRELDWCADCSGWLGQHSRRIVTDWVWWFEGRWNQDRLRERTVSADMDEIDNHTIFHVMQEGHHDAGRARPD